MLTILFYVKDFVTSGCTNLQDFNMVEIAEEPKGREREQPKFTFKLINNNTTDPATTKMLMSADNKKGIPECYRGCILFFFDCALYMSSWMNTLSKFFEEREQKIAKSQGSKQANVHGMTTFPQLMSSL